MGTSDIRTPFTSLGQYDLFGVYVVAEEVSEHREAEDVFEHLTYVLWKLLADNEELLFNSSLFEHIALHGTNR
jgi:hypothetical protein